MMTVGEAFDRYFDPGSGLRIESYDGSTGGDPDGQVVRLHSPEALNYLLTAPRSIGMMRAYLSGELSIDGMDEGNPYPVLTTYLTRLSARRPSLRELPDLARFVRETGLHVPDLPPQEAPAPWRRVAHGLRHGRMRDAAAISYHYDVSNRFYELLLGPSMAYTCGVYPDTEASLEEAQSYKFDLVCRKLGLSPGMRLLDVGCGWGGMVAHAVRHYGVTAVGVTLSRNQASWGQAMLEREGLTDRAEIRHSDYRDVTERGFDAVSSIGLTEHIGVRNYPAYFGFLRERLRDGGRLLNHCITRPDNRRNGMLKDPFTNRYTFPDGELSGVGHIISVMEDTGLEVRHQENLREHYARTTGAWAQNLSDHWDECVAEAGLGTARVWGVYLAGSRVNFEHNNIQLHQVLGVRTSDDGEAGLDLRPTWEVEAAVRD
ncbi:class I SAM-dependent methyltransferase [Ornithinimicrobium faecis]|uniref:class I SAM-dependent methyltransferase n=1 Tax=Ornithinimicrobium faecis TaxID=2934158 RepID=UPI0021180416|nr:class I SAM-dependent methyltransferase [Ornithinimicrobium sp. HY1745]